MCFMTILFSLQNGYVSAKSNHSNLNQTSHKRIPIESDSGEKSGHDLIMKHMAYPLANIQKTIETSTIFQG